MNALIQRLTALLIIQLIYIQCFNVYAKRNKRTLIYIPPGGVVQMVMGVGLPLVLNQEAIIVGMVLKAGYGLPHNSTDFTHPGVTYAKKKRSVSRWDVYDTMAQAAEIHGFGGKECVLRTICEVAEIPFHSTGGLFEELVHTIFTPSTTQEKVKRHTDTIYHAAEQLGKDVGSCETLFPECRVSFAEIYTRLHNY